MVNTSMKGSATELKAKKILEKQEFLVEKTQRARYKKNQDFFGVADLLAIKKDSKVKFVQVKTNRTGGALLRLREFAEKYINFDKVSIEVWVWYDRKGFKVYKLTEFFNAETGQNEYDWDYEKYIK